MLIEIIFVELFHQFYLVNCNINRIIIIDIRPQTQAIQKLLYFQKFHISEKNGQNKNYFELLVNITKMLYML